MIFSALALYDNDLRHERVKPNKSQIQQHLQQDFNNKTHKKPHLILVPQQQLQSQRIKDIIQKKYIQTFGRQPSILLTTLKGKKIKKKKLQVKQVRESAREVFKFKPPAEERPGLKISVSRGKC